MDILVAEDDTTSRLLLQMTLQKLGHQVTATQNGQEAWQVLQQGYFPLLISDLMMLVMDGLQLCRLVRSSAQKQYIYVIMLTALGDKESYLDGMDAGADDFVTKPFDEEQLTARLRVAERILGLHESLRAQAMHDGLTGLLNRTAIMDRLTMELDRGMRDAKSLSVVLLDLDHFKHVNDDHGHAAGDAVLRETAQRMKEAMRGYDAVSRYGGEEFLIVAPGCASSDGFTLAERVRSRIANTPMQIGEGSIAVTCSLGLATTSASPQEDAAGLIRRADDALYQAKANGRNRIEVAAVKAA